MRRGCAVLVAAALAAVGCGGKAKTTAAGHTRATTASTQRPTTATAGPGDCNALGINPTGMREGTCTHAGITYTIVNRSHILRLHTLSARIDGAHAVSALSGSQPTSAQMKFVIVSVTVTNRLSLPQRIDSSGTQQFSLILDGSVYKESVGTEKSSDPGSCQMSTHKINPSSSATCDVVFEVPSAPAADLAKHGRSDLYVVDFGSDLAASPPPQAVGQIRLYH